ncbi:MAG: hypothetical protein NTV05_17900 [Acidobacteria bacterium]|nr:hypothetical protein [Acidobacteriota bacterium]
MNIRLTSFAAALLAASLAQPLTAATSAGNVNVSVTVSARAKLELTRSTVTFANADPDVALTIPASEGTISITAKAKTAAGAAVTLTVIAASDLTSGGDSIAVTNVTWTVSGAGFTPGTLNKTTAQTVASWTGSGNRAGTQSYALTNSWSYPTGTFSTTATYTLTAP